MKLNMDFLKTCKVTDTKKGGSYASDDVTSSVDLAAFERIEFLLSGGSLASNNVADTFTMRGGMIPPNSSLPAVLASDVASLSVPMQSSYAQPLAPVMSMVNTMSFPDYNSQFSPLLSGSRLA